VAGLDSSSQYRYVNVVAIGTSHDFMKTLHNELKQSHKDLDFKNDTETFPKQAKITSRKKFGNALKVPGAVQRKSGKRSQLLDPDTKQPIDVIFITKVLELRLPEEEAVKVGVRQYLSAKSRPARASKIGTSATSQPAKISEMRPCILAAINKRLEGSEGNDMRVAIVCEALAAGKARDEIIALFKRQNDFDPTITAYYVDYIIERGYMHWKCEIFKKNAQTL
jgi:hypothetical protein